MLGDCFNCHKEGAKRRTFIVESSEVIENILICEACLSEFQEVEWIEIPDQDGAEGVSAN